MTSRRFFARLVVDAIDADVRHPGGGAGRGYIMPPAVSTDVDHVGAIGIASSVSSAEQPRKSLASSGHRVQPT
jgi:hypothetical protein